jgi:hypothetical protein
LRSRSTGHFMGATISYAGKHVLVTGGSEGIGFELAERFLSDGAVVSILARSQDKLDNAKCQLLVRLLDSCGGHTRLDPLHDFAAGQRMRSHTVPGPRDHSCQLDGLFVFCSSACNVHPLPRCACQLKHLKLRILSVTGTASAM